MKPTKLLQYFLNDFVPTNLTFTTSERDSKLDKDAD